MHHSAQIMLVVLVILVAISAQSVRGIAGFRVPNSKDLLGES